MIFSLKYAVFIGLFCLTTILLSGNNNRLRFLLKAITFTSLLLAFLAFLIHTLNTEPVNDIQRGKLFFDRVIDTEILVSFLSFALFAVIVFRGTESAELLFYKTIKTEKKYLLFLRIILFSSVITLFFFIIYLRTRAGWTASVIMIISMLLILKLHHNRKRDTKRNIIMLSAMLAVSVILSQIITINDGNERKSLMKTAGSIFQADYYTNQDRFNYWNASLKMFKEHPLSGIGAGKWAGLYPIYNGKSFTDENINMNSAINPHNDYFEILAEYGIFGFLFFTGFIITGLYKLFRKSKKNIIYLPFFISVLGLSVFMFFSFTKDNFWAMIVYTISMAVGYSGNYKFAKSNRLIIILNVFAIALILSGAGYYIIKYMNEREYLEAMKLKAKHQYNEMLIKLDNVSRIFYPADMNKMPVDYYRGVGYYELQQYDKALMNFHESRRYALYYPSIINNEASAYYMTGDKEKALITFKFLKDNFPNYIEPKINLLAIFANNKQDTEARELIIKINQDLKDTIKIKNYNVFLSIKKYYNEKLD